MTVHFRRWALYSPTLFLALTSAACSRSSATVVEGASSPRQLDAIPRQRDADDIGRFLAGLPGSEGSPLSSLESGAPWVEHRRQLDEMWHKAETAFVGGLREFQKQELSSALMRDSLVFYPFSGPDALTATVCFPDSPVYVFVGLEPAGTLPARVLLEKKDQSKYLGEIRQTMSSELGRSFFITHQMDEQFRGQITDGLIVPILHLLVRTQHTIMGFRYVRIDEDGQVVDRTLTEKIPGRFGNKGVEIEFRTDSDQSIHDLFYFSINLSDDTLRQNKPALAYLDRLNAPTTLFKATSYMTHRPEFSMIRNRVLAKSSAVLQDDSGIPYHNFDRDLWQVQLYGDYDKPYGSFKWLEQPDLREAFKAPGTKPLPMRIGYGFSRIPSNLLLARRVTPVLAKTKPPVAP